MESLLDGEALKSVMPYAKVHYRTFTAALEASLEEVSTNGLDMLSEDLQDAEFPVADHRLNRVLRPHYYCPSLPLYQFFTTEQF